MPARPVIALSRFGSALRPFCYRNSLFMAETGPAFASVLTSADASFRFAFPAEPSGLSDFSLRHVATTSSSLLSRQAAGDEIGLVVWQDQIVHRSLLQVRGTAHMEGDRNAFVLRARDRYVHSCFTSLAHRGKGVYSAMLRHILHTMSIAEPGLRVFIACRQENAASVRAIRRAGFVYVRSSIVFGIASGRLRYRRWYVDDGLAKPITANLPGVARAERHE
ncbi:MAG: GNAT family N-acetyltransferase [Gemmatimonadaceae bacterium]